MAGDWIKVEKNAFEKPEVMAIADELKLDDMLVVGALVKVWSWADSQSDNGEIVGVGVKRIDRVTGIPDFGAAMMAQGWVQESSESILFVNFDRHNGESAKKRAKDNRRKAQSRKKLPDVSAVCPQNVRDDCDQKRDQRREEKRRGENKKGRKATWGAYFGFWVPEPLLVSWEKQYGPKPVFDETQKAHAWLLANPDRTYKNYGAFLNNWLKRAGEDKAKADASDTNASMPVLRAPEVKND